MFCGCIFFSISANAQKIKSNDLKSARNAVYEWIRDYNIYAKCVGRSAKSNFYSLFDDESIEIYNDIDFEIEDKRGKLYGGAGEKGRRLSLPLHPERGSGGGTGGGENLRWPAGYPLGKRSGAGGDHSAHQRKTHRKQILL